MEYMLVFILTICINGLTAQHIRKWDDPQLVTEECRNSGCPVDKLCYIPHPASCFKFIMCVRYINGQIKATGMSCGFGTMWKPGAEPACDSFTQVNCHTDLCRDPDIKAYSHDKTNCRTYYKCRKGKSVPACCQRFHHFNEFTRQCEKNITCDSDCPLVNEATCQGNKVRFANVQDGNCKTYWDCKKGHAHPECCGKGKGFDVYKSKCVKDPNCLDVCPKEYSESCEVKGTLSYDMVDRNCRTYMKCNAEGQADPYCCLPGLMYNPGIKQCVDAVGKACSNARCPSGFKEVPECNLRAIPNDTKSYIVLSTPLGNVTMKCSPGSDFVQKKCRCLKKPEKCSLEAIPGKPRYYKNVDSYGGEEMPCAVGTIFNPQGCNCKEDPALKTKQPPVGCRVDIDAHLPDLKNYGTAVAAILMIGEYGHGEKGVGNMSDHWHGGVGLNIPFYGSQEFWKMYLEIRFNPSLRSTYKQIMLTSCQVTGGEASIEISMSRFSENSGIITLHAKNHNGNLVVFEFPYMFNKEYTFRIIYDGHNMGAFLDNQDPNLSNAAVEPFQGKIIIHRSGLRFTHCRYDQERSGFIGYVREIKVSRCLTQEMEDTLNTLVAGPPPAA